MKSASAEAQRDERLAIPAQVQQLEAGALGRGGLERGTIRSNEAASSPRLARDEGHAAARAEEVGQRGAAHRAERPPECRKTRMR